MEGLLQRGFTYQEMDLIPFCKGEPDGQAGVDAYGLALSHEERAAREVVSDGGGLLLGEVAGPLVGPEGRGGGAGAAEGAAVVVVGRVAEAVHGWRVGHGRWGSEGGHLGFSGVV